MSKEIYIWILVFVAILAAALYLRYLYQPVVGVAIGISSGAPVQFYPFQKTTLNISVLNTGGSAITNMSIGVLINGNLTTLYKVTLPGGKKTVIAYNYSPQYSGAYTLSAVADPGKLYNILDRSRAQANATIQVSAAQNATPSAFLPPKNITSLQGANVTRAGYIVAAHIAGLYNLSRFAFTDNAQVNNFMNPVFNVTSYYIRNISTANARYSDNSSVYSIWIRGYLSPVVLSVGASAEGLGWNGVVTKFGNVTFVKITNGTTFCGWYAGGWIKMLASNGKTTCVGILNKTSLNATAVTFGSSSKLYGRVTLKNATAIANYTGISKSGAYAGKMSLISNSSFVYIGIANNTVQNSTCYGSISLSGNSSYCTSYVFPKLGKSIQALSLIRTTTYIGSYNLTAFSLVNTSLVTRQIPVAVGLLGQLNVTGRTIAFKSGFVSSCNFNQSFPCSVVKYYNGTISLRVTNNMSKSVELNYMRCYTIGTTLGAFYNTTVSAGATANLNATCYTSGSSKISGLALGMRPYLLLNYTIGNSTRSVSGGAFIPFG